LELWLLALRDWLRARAMNAAASGCVWLHWLRLGLFVALLCNVAPMLVQRVLSRWH
jgi:hypothetical protein